MPVPSRSPPSRPARPAQSASPAAGRTRHSRSRATDSFLRTYGGPLDLPDEATRGVWDDDGRYWHAAESVKAFFDEGGATMYFQRVVPSGAASSTRAFNGGLQALVQSDVSPISTTVTLSHTFGVTDGDNLNFVAESGSVIGAATVASVDHNAKVVTLTAATGFSARRGQDLVSIVPVNAALNVLTVTASSAGVWGDDLSVRLLPVAGARLDLGPSPASGAPAVTATTADAAIGDAAVTVTPHTRQPGQRHGRALLGQSRWRDHRGDRRRGRRSGREPDPRDRAGPSRTVRQRRAEAADRGERLHPRSRRGRPPLPQRAGPTGECRRHRAADRGKRRGRRRDPQRRTRQ